MSLEHLWAGWRHEYVAAVTDAERGGAADAGGLPGADAGTGGDAGGAGGSEDDPARCVFCRIAASGPASADNLVVWRDDTVIVVLNLYPYASGHLLVLPARHLGAMDELDDAEAGALWAATRLAVGALGAAYAPDGVNLGANLGQAAGAGIPAHLHLHVVPRWSGDTNFMTTVGGTRVLPQPLAESWAALRGAWPAGAHG